MAVKQRVEHTAIPWTFDRIPDYEERARLLNQPLGDHEGYYRDNDGSWIIGGADGRVASVAFRGKAKRGETWNAPDPEGQANARLIVLAVNNHQKLVEMVKVLRGEILDIASKCPMCNSGVECQDDYCFSQRRRIAEAEALLSAIEQQKEEM